MKRKIIFILSLALAVSLCSCKIEGDFGFSEPEWETFKSEDGDRIVEFNGKCEYFGEEANCCVQFEISDEDDYFEVSAVKMFTKRIMWLIILLFASVFSTYILSSAESTLSTIAVLAVFMPMITASAGNAGSQTTALLIRGLSLGTIKTKDFFKALRKEFLVGILVGGSLAVICYAFLWMENIIGIIEVNENQLQQFKLGITFISILNKTPITPVYIDRRKSFWHREKIIVGESIKLYEYCSKIPTMPEIENAGKILFEKEQELKLYYETNYGRKK